MDFQIRTANGCLAMGDEAAEKLFVLAADTGLHNIKVILAPFDLRRSVMSPQEKYHQALVGSFYDEVQRQMSRLLLPVKPNLRGGNI